jgi:hypothetical protein
MKALLPLCALFASAALAGGARDAGADAASSSGGERHLDPDTVYRWTDASGEEHYTNDRATIPGDARPQVSEGGDVSVLPSPPRPEPTPPPRRKGCDANKMFCVQRCDAKTGCREVCERHGCGHLKGTDTL